METQKHYNKKFGLLVAFAENLGDDIQSIAAKQFLPTVDYYVDREEIQKYIPQDIKLKIIMNGWFAYNPKSLHLPQNFEPLFISFHLSPLIFRKVLNDKKVIKYLENFKIGCRDKWTENILKSRGLDAYFSGCLTLTLDFSIKPQKERNSVLIIDLEPTILEILPDEVLTQAKILSFNLFTLIYQKNLVKNIFGPLLPNPVKEKIIYFLNRHLILKKSKRIPLIKRFQKAEEILHEISRAKLVITSRLHAALPALAFNTPVLFVNNNLKDPRFTGLLEFLNHYDFVSFRNNIGDIDFETIKNPNQDELRNIKNKLTREVLNFINEVG
ncbi:MAG: polysaccharide pyruvyl transferase family protein [Leptospiraceae bacterium]|nr:polysaccharide pyruvyl transferase family protein [Leptospiraceae bacterium]